jgi:putative membrane protein
MFRGEHRNQPANSRRAVEEEITVMYWYGDHMSGWGWALASIGMVAFWGLLITGIVLLVRYLGRTSEQQASARTPEQLLAERFARGEIDESEYRDRLDALRGQVRS